jgi:prephenate dehydratase
MKRIAIQGIRGSYSEEAVREIFGADASVLECSDFESAFAAVEFGDADNAVVPIENKIVGAIQPTCDLLNASSFRVHERLRLRVGHVLAAAPGATFDGLVSVRSHIEALKQCRKFLHANPKITQLIGTDTASSIKTIIEERDLTRAAIGSRRAAALYGADIIRENVADDDDNWTMFYLIGN